jgi:hypothetical protein
MCCGLLAATAWRRDTADSAALNKFEVSVALNYPHKKKKRELQSFSSNTTTSQPCEQFEASCLLAVLLTNSHLAQQNPSAEHHYEQHINAACQPGRMLQRSS